MKVSQQIKMYATEDISSIIKLASDKCGVDFELKSLKFDEDTDDIDSRSESEDVTVTAVASIEAEGDHFEFSWEYLVDGDSIYIEDRESNLASELCNRFKESKRKVASSSAISKRKTRIVAADEDFDELTDDVVVDDNDTFSESIDNLSDQVEDIQDQVDDIQEDDVTIDTDNNISNHYIAECDTCHGIFISAVVESDQRVEKIAGVCPLCEKQTEQYLRWVVKDVKQDDEEQ